MDDTTDAVRDALDPSLTREEVIAKLQDIDESLSDFGSDDGDSDDDDSDDDSGDEDDAQ